MKLLLLIASAIVFLSTNLYSQSSTPILTLISEENPITIVGPQEAAKLEATASFRNDRTTMSETWMKVDNSELREGHQSYFCWDLCYTVEDTVSLDYQPVPPGTTYPGFFAHLEPNNVCGISRLVYTIYDGNNPSDNTSFTIVFDVQCLNTSVNEAFIPKNLFKVVSTNEYFQATPHQSISGSYSYEIVTPNGIPIYKEDFTNEILTPLSNYASGVYYVIIRNNGKPVDFYSISIQR